MLLHVVPSHKYLLVLTGSQFIFVITLVQRIRHYYSIFINKQIEVQKDQETCSKLHNRFMTKPELEVRSPESKSPNHSTMMSHLSFTQEWKKGCRKTLSVTSLQFHLDLFRKVTGGGHYLVTRNKATTDDTHITCKWSVFHGHSRFALTNKLMVGIFVSTLQNKELRLREVQLLSQGHVAGKWEAWGDLNPGLPNF